MSVHAREVEVVNRQRFQLFQGGAHRPLAGPDVVEQFRQFRLVHNDMVAEHARNRQSRFVAPTRVNRECTFTTFYVADRRESCSTSVAPVWYENGRSEERMVGFARSYRVA